MIQSGHAEIAKFDQERLPLRFPSTNNYHTIQVLPQVPSLGLSVNALSFEEYPLTFCFYSETYQYIYPLGM